MDSIPVSEERKAQLEQMAKQQGRDLASLADDLLALALEHHVLSEEEDEIRALLDGRYDEVVNGTAVLVDPQGARRELAARRAAQRRDENL